MKRRNLVLILLSAAMSAAMSAAHAQAGRSCAVQHLVHNDAADALAERKFGMAADLYEKQLEAHPDSTAAKVGLVRSRIGENMLPEAFRLATEYRKTPPPEPSNVALLEDLYGEVRFRRGEVEEAAEAFNQALHADACLGRVHYDLAQYQMLSGNYLTAQKQVDLARKLAPDDKEIAMLGFELHYKKPSTAEMVASITREMSKEGMSPEDKAKLEKRIQYAQATGNGSCELKGVKESAKVKMVPILGEDGQMQKMGLDVEMNGKRKRMMVDTGASGLTITRRAAAALGLTPEAETRVGGIGDEASIRTIVTHVDKLVIADMEFHNCKVEVLDRDVLGMDGLLGPDVFGRWLVTLDMPMRELNLAPLPRRPEAGEPEPQRLEAQGQLGDDHAGTGPQDRYIAPEMKEWTRVFRQGHNLIVPTRINEQPSRLFIMDTGAFSGMISPALARAVGNVSQVDTQVHGLSGAVEKVYTVDKQVTITFAGVSQPVRGITVMDMGAFARDGVEISGFVGFTALKELILSIDYRDNLIKVVFDPKHGFHSTGRMEY